MMSNYILIFIFVVLLWILMVFFHVNRVLLFSSQCSSFFSKKDILIQHFPKFQPTQDLSPARKSNFVGDSLRKIMEHQDLEYEVLKNKARNIEEHLKFLRTFPIMSGKEKMEMVRMRNESSARANSVKIENIKKYETQSKYLEKHSIETKFPKIGSKKNIFESTLQKIKGTTYPLKNHLLTDDSKTKFHHFDSGGIASTPPSIMSAAQESPGRGLSSEFPKEETDLAEESEEDTYGLGSNSTEDDYHFGSEENEISNLSYWDPEVFRQNDGLLEDQKQMFSRHSFNVAASDALPWNRSMPDTRVARQV